MATYSKGANGAFSGKVGSVIGRSCISKRKTGVSFSNKKHSLENTKLKTKVQHIDKNMKPRLAVMWIGLIVYLA